ncbi:DUF2341 domain-containing protein, partial [Spirochaetota bacterium]
DTLYFFEGEFNESISLLNRTNVNLIAYPWLTNSDNTASIIKGPGSGIGIYISNSSGNTFRGFMLSNWNTAVKIYGASRANVIADNIIRDCTSVGIFLANSMSYNTNTNNTIDGIEHGIMISNSHHDYAARNIIRNCTKNGVFIISNSFSNTVILNTITNNTLAGIHVSGGSFSNEITHNNIMYHDTNLLHLDAGENNYLSNYFGYIKLSSVEGTIEGTNTNGFIPYRLGFIGITQGDTTPPPIPVFTNASNTSSGIELYWEDVGGDVSGYRIYRSTTNTWTNFSSYAADVGNVTAWTDTSTVEGVTNYYFITSYDNPGDHENESWFSVSTNGYKISFPAVGWYDIAWGYRKKITLDPGMIYGTLTNFPWLVVLTNDPDIAANAQPDGDDILFTFDDGTSPIIHEIDSYSNNGTLYAWLKIPILSGTTNTNIYIYYGNSGAGNMSDPTNVWDTHYGGVWHLSETTGSTNFDSTRYGNHAIQSNSPIPTNQSVIGGAIDFNGVDQYLKVQTTAELDLSSTNSFSISTWLDLDDVNTVDTTDSAFMWEDVINTSANEPFRIELNEGTSAAKWFPSGMVMADVQKWPGASDHVEYDDSEEAFHYLMISYDGAYVNYYLDGYLYHSTALTGNVVEPTDGALAVSWYIGCGETMNSRYMNGRLDEIRISLSYRSSNWIATSYTNQFSGAGASTVGPVENQLNVIFFTNPLPDVWIGTNMQTFSGIGGAAVAYVFFGTNLNTMGLASGSNEWSTNVDLSLLDGKTNIFYVISSNNDGSYTTNQQTNYMDFTPPVVAVTNPTNEDITGYIASYSGTNYDNAAPVTAAFYNINGGAWTPTDETNLNWTITIPPQVGKTVFGFMSSNSAGLVGYTYMTNYVYAVKFTTPVSGTWLTNTPYTFSGKASSNTYIYFGTNTASLSYVSSDTNWSTNVDLSGYPNITNI